MYWMTLIGFTSKQQVSIAKPPKARPTFTETYLHGNRCMDPKCTRKVPQDRPNGFLCWEHDLQVFPLKPQSVPVPTVEVPA